MKRRDTIPQTTETPVNPALVYSKAALMQALGVGEWTLREWQQEGLRYHLRSNRRFYHGRDVVEFLTAPPVEAGA